MTTIDADNGTRKQRRANEIQKHADTSHWFKDEVKIPLQVWGLLREYANLRGEEVVPHITLLRQRAIAKWPYSCIGQLRFLDLTASTHPAYGTVLERLKDGQTHLDTGCYIGQDIRKLLLDGAPSSVALYGTDIEPGFFDLGKELFRDDGKIESRYFAADLTKSVVSDPTYNSIRQHIDIIRAQSKFHLFTLDDQRTLAEHLVALSKPILGSMIIGRQVGSREGGTRPGLTPDTTVFALSPATWRQFWKDIGTKTGSEWQVEVTEEEVPGRVRRQTWCSPDLCILVFTILRQQLALS